MKLSSLRELMENLEDIGLEDSFRDVVEALKNEETDFEIDGYRFIHEDEIDEILVDELEADPYVLGCFNAWFIADNTHLSIDIVETLQKNDAYKELGQHIIDNNYTEDLAYEYVRLDGYGHHFATYDGENEEILLPNNNDTLENYYVFRIN